MIGLFPYFDLKKYYYEFRFSIFNVFQINCTYSFWWSNCLISSQIEAPADLALDLGKWPRQSLSTSLLWAQKICQAHFVNSCPRPGSAISARCPGSFQWEIVFGEHNLGKGGKGKREEGRGGKGTRKIPGPSTEYLELQTLEWILISYAFLSLGFILF